MVPNRKSTPVGCTGVGPIRSVIPGTAKLPAAGAAAGSFVLLAPYGYGYGYGYVYV